MATEVREQWFRTLGRRTLLANEPQGTRAMFVSRGFPVAYWNDYLAGYEAAYEALSLAERRSVAEAYYRNGG
jgi:hypothetical protein